MRRAGLGAMGLCLGLMAQSHAMADAPPPAVPPPVPPVISPVILPGIAPSTQAVLPSATTGAKPPRIATSVLAARPLMSGGRLSPDGRSVAARLSMQGHMVLGVVPLFEGKPHYIPLDMGDVSLNWFKWAGNTTLLLSIGKTVVFDGDDAYQTRLAAFDMITGKMHFIGDAQEGLRGDDILWIDPEGKTLLMSYQATIYDYPSVWSVDIAANKRRKVLEARDNVWDWYADQAGVVRAGLTFLNKRWEMLYRHGPADQFRNVVQGGYRFNSTGQEDMRIFAGSDEGYRTLLNEETGRYALYRFNFATRERGVMVFSSSTNDVEDFDTTRDGQQPFWVSTIDSRDQSYWFDKDMGEVQAAIDKAVGANRRAVIVSASRDHQTLLVHVGGSDTPGSYYFYMPEAGTMRNLAKVNEALKSADMVATRYVTYKARDGLDIPAYLTLPAGRDPRKLPLILLPHGGPFWVRDQGDFDEEVQFYANRGYAVLQPQFRGSDSYGKAFLDAGKGQWGRAMQNDLDDGMDWLVKQGVVDAGRVCIIGSSYGGYAAMWGAIRNPERYRCAASFAGVMDIARQVKYTGSFDNDKSSREDWRKMVQGEDASFDLKTVSPQFNVAGLKVPLLVMHGDKDQRVPIKQSRLFVDALTAAGKPVEFYTLTGEGHGFSTTANQQQWFDRLDTFLAKYNPAD